MMCFFALMVIDWTRGSQVGSTWAWTVNMTGVVMAVILFSAYSLKDFCKPVYGIYSVLCLAALPISYYWWNLHQAAIYRDKLLTAVINVWLLGIFVIKWLIEIWEKRQSLNLKCLILTMKSNWLETLTVLMLLLILFSKNEDVWSLWYLAMFGLFYHTKYDKKLLSEMQQGMLDGIILSFFVLQGAAFIFRPFDDFHKRYKGIYSNCNITALFYSVVFVALILKLFYVRRNNDKKWKEVLCFLFAGGVLGFVILTISKTAWISLIIVSAFYIIFADFYLLKRKAGRETLAILGMVIIMLMSVPIDYMAIRYLPPIFHHPIWFEGEYEEWKVHSWDPWDSEKYVSWEEMKEAISSRIEPFIRLVQKDYHSGLYLVHAEEVLDVEEASLPNGIQIGDTLYNSDEAMEYSSSLGRISIWEYYLKHGNIQGHSNLDGHIQNMSTYVWHAQNMFVQYWYYYGIPSAVLFVIIGTGFFLQSIKRIKKGNICAICSLLYLALMGVFGLFEAVWYPGQMIFWLMFFCPILMKKMDE